MQRQFWYGPHECPSQVTADQGRRGGKSIDLKKISDDAMSKVPLCSPSPPRGSPLYASSLASSLPPRCLFRTLLPSLRSSPAPVAPEPYVAPVARGMGGHLLRAREDGGRCAYAGGPRRDAAPTTLHIISYRVT